MRPERAGMGQALWVGMLWRRIQRYISISNWVLQPMSLEVLREITKAARWREIAQSVVLRHEAPPVTGDDFGTHWIEAGRSIREQVADDKLLCRLLRLALPKYVGATVTLYRGENIGRWRAGSLGLAWTPDLKVARMFGSGLNATETGGVLLRGTFEPPSIISSPSKHSRYLQEEQFTVDPSLARDLKVIEEYPPQ